MDGFIEKGKVAFVAPEEIRRTTVLRVEIEGWSGKEKKEIPDFPGAYFLEEARQRA